LLSAGRAGGVLCSRGVGRPHGELPQTQASHQDAGTLLPGLLAASLDRVDSLLFVIPLGYYTLLAAVLATSMTYAALSGLGPRVRAYLQRQGDRVSFLWGFSEATVFFILPDVAVGRGGIVRVCGGGLARHGGGGRRRGLGGVVLYLAARWTGPPIRMMLDHVPGVPTSFLTRVQHDVAEQGGLALSSPDTRHPLQAYAAEWALSDGAWARYWLGPCWPGPRGIGALRDERVGVRSTLASLVRADRPGPLLLAYLAGWVVDLHRYSSRSASRFEVTGCWHRRARTVELARWRLDRGGSPGNSGVRGLGPPGTGNRSSTWNGDAGLATPDEHPSRTRTSTVMADQTQTQVTIQHHISQDIQLQRSNNGWAVAEAASPGDRFPPEHAPGCRQSFDDGAVPARELPCELPRSQAGPWASFVRPWPLRVNARQGLVRTDDRSAESQSQPKATNVDRARIR